MSIEQIRANLTGRVWQAIAQSGVDTTSIPRDQLDRMVGAIVDGVLIGVNELLDETSPKDTDTAAALRGEEQVLWEGRPFLSLSEHYQITSERIRITKGLFGKDREDIELIRIQDIDQSQRITERMLNIGDIVLRSADPSSPEITLHNIADPLNVHEILRRAVLNARQRHRVGFREEI